MGTATHAAQGESWPEAKGEPMHAVLQLVTRDLPVRPAALDGIELLTLFVADELPVDEPNGVGWCLRTYASLEGLQPLERPRWERDPRMPKAVDSALKPFPLRFTEVEDWPSLDDIPLELAPLWEEHTEDEDDPYRPHMGLKVGGWPYGVQGEVDWYERGEVLSDVEFVIQVDSDDKVGFVVADSGVFYVGRRAGTGTWHATWQTL
jgi:Domain of unknown function (DUF1963)